MRHFCFARCFLAYTTLCGLVLVTVAFYDLSSSTSNMVFLPSTVRPVLDLSRFVQLPERLSFCSVKKELLNQSEPQSIVVPQQPSQDDNDTPQRVVFDPNKSTEENYSIAADDKNQPGTAQQLQVGRFASIRRQLDYSYHRVYTAERQELQDSILSGMLDKTKRLACTGQQHHATDNRDPPPDLPDQWIIFTAGVMGECFHEERDAVVSVE